jgi:PAS domain S-box-containing protein
MHADLRARAEAFLGANPEATHGALAVEGRELIHELDVYQAELEMQNEELRQAQLELSRSRDLFVELYDFAPVAYLTIDRQGVIREANLTAAALLAAERSKLMGRRILGFIDPAFRQAWSQQIRAFYTDGDGTAGMRLDLPMQDAAGRRFWALIEGRRRPTAAENTMVSITDVSEQKAVEAELRESQARFMAIAGTTPVGIGIVAEREATFLYVNPSCAASTGYAPDELLGQPAANIFADRAEPQRLLAQFTAEGRVLQREVTLRRKDGSSFWVLCSIAPITYAGQQAHLGVFADISAQKRMEEMLRERNDDLSRFNTLMVGRELRMVDLKREVNALCARLGEPAKYDVGEEPSS